MLFFKTIFKELCEKHPSSALRILPFIGELGRYDYILEGINTPIEKEVISLDEIKSRELTQDRVVINGEKLLKSTLKFFVSSFRAWFF